MAAHACRRPRRSFAGKIRGAALEVGHLLRGAHLPPLAGTKKRVRCAIVGAGPSGLCAAWRLERAGFSDFEIYELEGVPGGTSASGHDGIVPYPWGAHYVPLPGPDNPALRILLEEVGTFEKGADGKSVAKETLRIREPEERLFIDGEWREGLFPSHGATRVDFRQMKVFENEVMRWSAWRDEAGRRAFTIPMRKSSEAPPVMALDAVSAAKWLREHGIASERVLWYLELCCRDDYGSTLAETSAWALLFYFCARRERPMGPSHPFVTWPEGNGRLVRHLAETVGKRLKLSQLVTEVVNVESGVQLSVFDVKQKQHARVVAEHVILACPQFVNERLMRGSARSGGTSRERHDAKFNYGVWMVANLHLSRPPKSIGAVTAWDNVLYDSPSLGYVVAGHQTGRDQGRNVWTYYLPLTDADPARARRRLLELDHRTCCDMIVSDLERAHEDLASVVERIDIYKWGHAMVLPKPGFVSSEARKRAGQPNGAIHFAHSDLSGVALFEEAQDRGILAAEAILRARGQEVSPLQG